MNGLGRWYRKWARAHVYLDGSESVLKDSRLEYKLWGEEKDPEKDPKTSWEWEVSFP